MAETEHKQYLDVALPVPIDRSFSYSVADGDVRAGIRVLVPWGKQRLVGLVLAVHERAPEIRQPIKPIELALDREPVVDGSVLELAKWTAAYYQAPLGEVLRCVLPPAAELKERNTLTLTEAGHDALATGQRILFSPVAAPQNTANGTARKRAPGANTRAEALQDLLRAVDSRNSIALEGALVRYGRDVVTTALRRDWLRLETDADVRSGLRVERYYQLCKEQVADTGRKRRRTAQQNAALALLEAEGGKMPASELAAQVSLSALHTLRREGRIAIVEMEAEPRAPEWHPRPRVAQLNASQAQALAAVTARLAHGSTAQSSEAAGSSGVILLHGVTGSGKTAVYIEAIQQARARNQAVLMLVPEIGLTSAVFADVAAAFPGEVAILHSGLSDAERAQHWQRARRGVAPVVIGTRSAVFASLPNLALIIVDEEHDPSYKQQETPRYNARDLAVLRGKLLGAAVVLGSATPSLESYTHAQSGKYALVEMRERVESRPLPEVRLVDMRLEFRAAIGAQRVPPQNAGVPGSPVEANDGVHADNNAAEDDQSDGANSVNHSSLRGLPRWRGRTSSLEARQAESPFSAALVEAIRERLDRHEQSVVLINRRGYSPVVLCRSCGATVMCRDCSLSLTYHKRTHRLICHMCGFESAVPERCPSCSSEYLYFIGTGSEKVEEHMSARFPKARIARLDRDTAGGRRRFAEILGSFRAGEYDILIGTQMIAKGHDVPGVTLVGVINADVGLSFPEFRAAERTFQLLTQVAGRAGRGSAPGEVIFQVLHPEHYAVVAAAENNYSAFYAKEGRFRRLMHYPPFAALAMVQLRSTDYDRVLAWTVEVGRALERFQTEAGGGTKIMGPAPAPIARVKNEHRFQFLIKSESRRRLSNLLTRLREFAVERNLPPTALVIDVDPI